jgi:hypothetical protein
MRKPMRTVVVVLLAAGLGVSSAFLVSCGDRNSLIPKSDAAAMRSDLDQASSLYAQEECRRAEAKVADARSRASRLPPEVDRSLQTTLAENLDTVLAEVTAQCGKTTSTQTTTTPTNTNPTVPTTPSTSSTSSTPTHTTPDTTSTPPPSTPSSTSTPPPSNPGGSGGTPPANSGGASG